MSLEWNGEALQNDFAAELSDVSSANKARVLQWINDIQREISSLGDFDFFLKEGRKTLVPGAKIQSLLIATPGIANGVVSAGGSLAGATYTFKVSFYESVSGLESLPSIASASIATTVANKTITLTMPISPDALVTARKIYVSKDAGDYIYHSTISNNTATSHVIASDSSSSIGLPEYSQIRSTSGNLTILNQGLIEQRPQGQVRELYSCYNETGTPSVWANLGGDSVLMYPQISSALVCAFFYYRVPARLYASTESIPEIPIYLKEVLRAGVMARGYMYSDRDGKIEKNNIYENLLNKYISKRSQNAKGVFRVRDRRGRSDGREV
jgi:hypothetical protein